MHSSNLALPRAGPQSSVVNRILPLSPYASLDKVLGMMLLFNLSVLAGRHPS